MTTITLDDINFVDTDFAYRGFLEPVTVNGTSYPRFQALWVAGLIEVSNRAVAAGGGVATAAFNFNTSTSDADPGAGKLAFNHASPASATRIYVNLTDALGVDVTTFLDSLDDSTNTQKGYVRVGVQDDRTIAYLFSLTAVTTATGYRKLTISYVSGSGTIASADSLLFSFVRTGDVGATGSNGNGPVWANTSGGSANAQTLTPSPALGSLTGNPSYEFIAGFSNTAALTMNVSSTGATTVRNIAGNALSGGEVIAGFKYIITLNNSTQWVLSSALDIVTMRELVWAGSAGGTANALTLTPATALGSYVKSRFMFLATATNTAAATVAISGLSAAGVKRADGNALTGGEIVSGNLYEIVYDGTNFRLSNSIITAAKLGGYTEMRASISISSNTITLDHSLYNVFKVASNNADITGITDNGLPASGTFCSWLLILVGDGTQRALTLPAAYKTVGAATITPTSTSGKVDIFLCWTDDGGTTKYIYVGGQNS